jgi:glycosyltransferase involved in cell wall biosynthesis
MLTLHSFQALQKCCIIIPCFNEENRLPVAEIEAFLIQNGHIQLLGVNDGSSDRTLALLQTLEKNHPGHFAVYNMPANAGKAEAVRMGMLHAMAAYDVDYFGFWDADLSTPLTELNWFSEFSGGNLVHDIVMGSRISRLGSHINRKMMRHYLGRVFATFTSLILKLKVYDTQCGAKIFKKDIVNDLFSEPFKSKWFFDVELLARYLKLYGHDKTYERALEVPLRCWVEVKGSKLKPTDFLKVPFELIKIKRHYKL